jgi:aerobic-type carbon monoxide dehydrogenase small subunit (CoxS/CutS family)
LFGVRTIGATRERGRGMRNVQLNLSVNGETAEASFAPYKTLLEVLREDLALTGTKHGCELGECGACAVLVDGEPQLSCLLLAVECAGPPHRDRRGAGAGRRAAPAAAAFADLGAAQCGYCTPGILMTAKALLEREPNPSRERIRRRSRATCAAAPATSRSTRRSRPPPRSWSASHESHRQAAPARRRPRQGHRPDALRRRPRPAAHAAHAPPSVSPSPRAHRTNRNRKSQGPSGRAPRADGKDFPVSFGILPVTQDEYPLAPEHVRYVGDPVAAVVAKDEQTASEALDLIEVKYKLLKTISDPMEALQNPEPRIHAYSELGNIHRLQAFEFSGRSNEVTEAIDASDHVFEDLFFYEGNTHLPIEQHASVAEVDGEGKLTLWSSTQVPHYVHRSLARVLQLPPTQIRVIATPNGGGFGGKCDVCNHEMAVAKAAMVLGRPVKICLNREEVFYMHRGRHPVLMKFRTGVTKDGKLTGMHLQTLVDGGGYGSYGVASTFYTGALQTVTYELPRYKFEAARVFTNKPPCGPKRGHGTPQPRFGQEIQLDKIAEKLGIDPAELRLGMIVKPDSLTANWLKVGSIGLAECIDKLLNVHPSKTNIGNFPSAAASASPAARTSAAPACRSTTTRCRRAECSSSSTAAARSPSSAARPRSARAPTTSSSPSSPRCSASIPSPCAALPATPASRRSTSAPTRAASR